MDSPGIRNISVAGWKAVRCPQKNIVQTLFTYHLAFSGLELEQVAEQGLYDRHDSQEAGICKFTALHLPVQEDNGNDTDGI